MLRYHLKSVGGIENVAQQDDAIRIDDRGYRDSRECRRPPGPSPLGAIFAEPYEVHPYPRSYEVAAQIITYNALAKFSMLPGGYLYGGPNTYFYPGPYYGGPYYTDGIRLPYACSLYGYC